MFCPFVCTSLDTFFFKGCFKLLSECGTPPRATRHSRSVGSRGSEGGWRRGEQGAERAGEARLAGSLRPSGRLLSDLCRFHQDTLGARLSVGLFPQHHVILIKEIHSTVRRLTEVTSYHFCAQKTQFFRHLPLLSLNEKMLHVSLSRRKFMMFYTHTHLEK